MTTKTLAKLLFTAALAAGPLARTAPADWWSGAKKKVGGAVSGGSHELQKRAGQAAQDAGRDLREQREKAAKELAKVEELRRQAEAVVRRFEKLKSDAEELQRNYERLQRMGSMDDAQLRREAYQALMRAGVMGSNRPEQLQGLKGPLNLVITGAEFDHFEQVKLAAALTASAGTANPGPALAYLKQFAAATRGQIERGLRTAPVQVRRKFEREFEQLLVRSMDQAVRGGRPVQLTFEGASARVGLLTFNNWVTLSYESPELVKGDVILVVQTYGLRMVKRETRVPLPNTFLPYAEVSVRLRQITPR